MQENLTNTSVTGTQVEDMTPDYVAAIKELKQNSVSRSDYDALREENKKLLNAVVNGQVATETVQAEVLPTQEEIQGYRKKLFTPDNGMSNLEYVQNALNLRNALIKTGEPDPFIPIGKQISPTDVDIATAEKVATVYQECIDYARGDSEAFTNELMRRTRDVGIIRRK